MQHIPQNTSSRPFSSPTGCLPFVALCIGILWQSAVAYYSIGKQLSATEVVPPFSHHPDIVLCPNGDYLIAYKEGSETSNNPVLLIRSTDKGKTWGGKRQVGLDHPSTVMTPFFSRVGDRIWLCYITGEDSRSHEPYLSYSDDNGHSWSEWRCLPTALTFWFGKDIIQPKDGSGDLLWCGWGGMGKYDQEQILIRKSTDNGESWNDLTRFTDMRRHPGMTYTPNGDILVMANGGKAYRSSDHGRTWQQTTTAGLNSGCLSLLTHENTLWGFDRVPPCSNDYALGSRRSVDNGATWEDAKCLLTYTGRTGDANHIDGIVDDDVLCITYYWNDNGGDQRIGSKRFELTGSGGTGTDPADTSSTTDPSDTSSTPEDGQPVQTPAGSLLFECEILVPTDVSTCDVRALSTASAGHYLKVYGKTVSLPSIDLPPADVPAGSYRILLDFSRQAHGAVVAAELDGHPLGLTMETGQSAVEPKMVQFDLGIHVLSAGSHVLRLDAVGKTYNLNDDRCHINPDVIKLVPIDDATQLDSPSLLHSSRSTPRVKVIRGTQGFCFEIAPGAEGAIIELFSVDGKLVRTLHMNSAAGRVRWDGSDSRGRALSRGPYLLRCVTPEGVEATTVVVR